MSATIRARPRPAVLCILDGWGWRSETADNAIACARTPNYETLLKGPHALLSTSGRAVGLPAGQMGNSEVGHMTIGSGRVVAQDLPRIDDAIADGSIERVSALNDLIDRTKQTGGKVHVLGLLSPGGVHSHQDHILALVRILDSHALPVCIHAFLDGRDTPPKSGAGFIAKFEQGMENCSFAAIATTCGRYYAMDRDKRWDRVEKAYQTIVEGKGANFPSAIAAIEASYANGISDEFLSPCRIGGYSGMADGDALLFANFRADRARELTLAILDPSFAGFARGRVRRLSAAASLTEYSAQLNAFMRVLFPPEDISETLGEYVSRLGMKQLRI
ncbi:MAG: phosphoglycerate mutase (2,3-diphosphoglycerate-independent), partial [Alphaproteobacteria bacterium]|nr:phosphoglycerate mutase (2,3-diphosphoglycerate-independent) [Alphaproteobacteria bacterium]